MDALALAAGQAAARIEMARLYAQLEAMKTELRRAREQLARTARMATVGDAASTLAYGINNRMQAILNITHLMAKDVGQQGVRAEDVAAVEAEAARASRLLGLLHGMPQSDGPAWGVHDLSSLLSSAVSASAPSASSRGVTTVVDLDPDAPSLLCDGNQMESVFRNLIDNACNAMPTGGWLTVSTRATDGGMEIRLADTGVGIPAGHLERVFDPFFTTKSETEGAGLGLAACRRTVEGHGGAIGLESLVGEGTTVTIRLPRHLAG
jgi:signal transduction histidine kinase